MNQPTTTLPATAENEPESIYPRFAGLETRRIHGFDAIVANDGPARQLGLRNLVREDCPEALLIPNTNSIDTVGMLFDVDVLFINSSWEPTVAVREVPAGETVEWPDAAHVLILPSDWDVEKWERTVNGKVGQ